jgi:hypothetical protein
MHAEAFRTLWAPSVRSCRAIVPGQGPVFEGEQPIDDTLDYLRFVADVTARPGGRAEPAGRRQAY